MATPTRSKRGSGAGHRRAQPARLDPPVAASGGLWRRATGALADVPVPAWAAATTFALAVIGLGLSVYLTFMHFDNPTGLACPAGGHIDCTKVVTSSWSAILGIPVPAFGILFFVAMVALCSPWGWRISSPLVARARVAATVVGLGMVLWLVFVEVYELDTICLWCTSVHLVTFALFLLVGRATVNAGLTLRQR